MSNRSPSPLPRLLSTAFLAAVTVFLCSSGLEAASLPEAVPAHGSAAVQRSSENASGANPDAQPVARVNGVTIYRSDLSCAVEASIIRRLSRGHGLVVSPGADGESALINKTLRQLINLELLYQESLKHRFPGLMAETEERYWDEARRLGGEDKLLSALKCNNVTPEQFRKSTFRNLAIQRYLDKVVYSKIEVSDEEIREFYEAHKKRFLQPRAVRLSQILIKVPGGQGDLRWRRAEDQARAIYVDALKGADFGTLVRRYTDDPAGASSEGDMGFIQAVESINGEGGHSLIGSVVSTLKAGSVTGPIRSREGFHIVKVTGVKPPTFRALEDVRPQIATIIRHQLARDMISDHLEKLKRKSEIEIIKNGSR